jgi:hypothetical protein
VINWREWIKDASGAYCSGGVRIRPLGSRSLVTGANENGLLTTHYEDVYDVSYSDGESAMGMSTAKSADEIEAALVSVFEQIEEAYENRLRALQAIRTQLRLQADTMAVEDGCN